MKTFENGEAVLAWQMIVSKWRIERKRLKAIRKKIFGNRLPITTEMANAVEHYLQSDLDANARKLDSSTQ